MLFDIMTGAIAGVVSVIIWMFVPESTIASVNFLGEIDGVPILLNKPILVELILILFISAPDHHLHPFLMPPIIFL